MAEKFKIPKRTKWSGRSSKRCKKFGCNHRVRSYDEIGLCNKCVNDINRSNKEKKRLGIDGN